MGTVLRRKRSRLVGWGPVVAFTIAACSPVTEPEAESSGDLQPCTNAVVGYSISYPTNWKTNKAGALPSCSVFDPNDVNVPEGTEIPLDLAVSIVEEPSPIGTALAGYAGVQVIEQSSLVIDGHNAYRLEILDPEPLSGDGPQRSTHYLVDMGKQTLIASSYEDGQPAYDRKKGVLEKMIETLKFTAAATHADAGKD